MHHFIICVISLLSFISSCYFALQNKKNVLAPNKRTIFYSQNKEILRWRTASTSIKFGQNNDQTTTSTQFHFVRTGSRNRTEIGVDRALRLTGTSNPGAGVEVWTNFYKTERIAGTNGIPSSAAGRARQLFLMYTIVRFLYPVLEVNILLWPNIASLQLYIGIWHIADTIAHG